MKTCVSIITFHYYTLAVNKDGQQGVDYRKQFLALLSFNIYHGKLNAVGINLHPIFWNPSVVILLMSPISTSGSSRMMFLSLKSTNMIT